MYSVYFCFCRQKQKSVTVVNMNQRKCYKLIIGSTIYERKKGKKENEKERSFLGSLILSCNIVVPPAFENP